MQQGFPGREQLVELGYRRTFLSWLSGVETETKLKIRCNEPVPSAAASLTEKLCRVKFTLWKCRESGIRDEKYKKWA